MFICVIWTFLNRVAPMVKVCPTFYINSFFFAFAFCNIQKMLSELRLFVGTQSHIFFSFFISPFISCIPLWYKYSIPQGYTKVNSISESFLSLCKTPENIVAVWACCIHKSVITERSPVVQFDKLNEVYNFFGICVMRM